MIENSPLTRNSVSPGDVSIGVLYFPVFFSSFFRVSAYLSELQKFEFGFCDRLPPRHAGYCTAHTLEGIDSNSPRS